MDHPEAVYEVILNPFLVRAGVGGRIRRSWSWRKLNADRLVEIHSDTYPGLRDAYCSAMAYRRRTGGNGRIKVNLDSDSPADAPDVHYLANADFESELRSLASIA